MIATAIGLLVFSGILLKNHDDYLVLRWYEVIGGIFAVTGTWLLFAGVMMFLWRAMP